MRIRVSFHRGHFPASAPISQPPNFRTGAQRLSAERPQSDTKRHPVKAFFQDDQGISGPRLPVMTGRRSLRGFVFGQLTIACDTV